MTKHLSTRMCCGHLFTAEDIKPPLLTQRDVFGQHDVNLYGGNVHRFSNAECPKCGKACLLWLNQCGQTWRVLTISDREQAEEAQADAPPIKRQQTRREVHRAE